MQKYISVSFLLAASESVFASNCWLPVSWHPETKCEEKIGNECYQGAPSTEDECCANNFAYVGGVCTGSSSSSPDTCYKAVSWWPHKLCSNVTGDECSWDPASTYDTEQKCCDGVFGGCDTVGTPTSPVTCYQKDTWYPLKLCKEISDIGGGECSGALVYSTSEDCCDSFYGGCDSATTTTTTAATTTTTTTAASDECWLPNSWWPDRTCEQKTGDDCFEGASSTEDDCCSDRFYNGCTSATAASTSEAATTTAATDCAGVVDGTAVYDSCYVCGGDNSTCEDCAGVANGTAVYDACYVCGGDNSTCEDCSGTINGTKKFTSFNGTDPITGNGLCLCNPGFYGDACEIDCGLDTAYDSNTNSCSIACSSDGPEFTISNGKLIRAPRVSGCENARYSLDLL